MEELYVKDIKVWIPNAVSVWESATIIQNYKDGDKALRISLDDGTVREIIINSDKDLPHLRNPAILIGQNDLTALSYLHEPDVLHNLEVRFLEKQTIYTYCGIVLVAINPYCDLPLYGLDIIRAYRGHSMGELEPHIFAIAEEAFTKLEREKSDISIIVSGESGAGKTMSAKYAMRYFAAVGGNESQTQIERKVLASSPVMEAFGNAKTIRNNNSSRFGKFTQLLFQNAMGTMSLQGATMKTYLLEKSRVVFQSSEERNYHIFYQLCAAKDSWSELLLDNFEKFHFLNQGNPDQQETQDKEDFEETVASLRTLGFSSDMVAEIMRVLAAILHLGNIQFVSSANRNGGEGSHEDSCNVAVSDIHLSVFCDLLHVNKKDLRKWLISRQIDSYNEQVIIPHDQAAAETARDALAKHIYARLFDYIVQVINKNLVANQKHDCFIGVLDIYGFETFEINSFEQFCINYANEKLQQQFNQHVFKLEQQEYLKEGIVWTMIDFYDNQPCIDLIETRLGVLDLLDEECRMINGTDDALLTKMYEKCTKFNHFSRPRFGQTAFLIRHFSDIVEYEIQGFVEKNRDHISKELVGVLQMSDMLFCRQLMCLDQSNESPEKKEGAAGGGDKVLIRAAKYATLTKQQRKTVGSQFRESLSSLISTLHATTSHYVRCIKPNENKAAFKWEPQKIVQQLRACGVLETVRISAAGFPSRWTYRNFYDRYYLLCKKSEIVKFNIQATAEKIVRKRLKDDDKYRFGKTQIFFRAGQVAYLEQLRSDLRKRYIILMQAHIRRFIYQHKYQRLYRTALGLQCRGRGLLARRRAKLLRETKAAITIQRYFRGYICRQRYLSIRRAVLGIQVRAKGLLARRKYNVTLNNYKAIQIQRLCRGYLARRRFKNRRRHIVIVQSLVRRFLAKRQLKKLKAEARTIDHIQRMYKGLESKIFELQQKNDVLVGENQQLRVTANQVPDFKKKLENLRNIENELKTIIVTVSEKENQLQALQDQLRKEQDEKMDILQEKSKLEERYKAEQTAWLAARDEFEAKLENLADRKESPTARHRMIISGADSNEVHNAYQKSIKEKELIEHENNTLKIELKRLQYILAHPNELEVYSKSHSNEDSLESKRSSTQSDNQLYESSREKLAHKDATSIILRLRKLLEEEKVKADNFRKDLDILQNKASSTFTMVDVMRLSEMELENARLKNDYQLLRNSIDRNVVGLELEEQYQAMRLELDRSREEVVQLKAILAQQSIQNGSTRAFDDVELAEAYQSQKSVNKQLELELKAITEEQNAKLKALYKQLDMLIQEKNELLVILQTDLDKTDDDNKDLVAIIKQNNYLRFELQKATAMFVELQEAFNELQTEVNELAREKKILLDHIRDQGLSDPLESMKSAIQNNNGMVVVKKKAQNNYQGIFKYRYEDEAKILQRLVNDLTPRVAISLLPGLPAIILFMCIRYTDLVNSDQHVRTLLSQFVLGIKKINKVPSPIEIRILWLVNAMTLLNLLKQYGGIDEYIQFNTDIQNQQQLKNFDLSEYRQVIHEVILSSYGVLIRQLATAIKPYIVSAVLEHDEMSRGWNQNINPKTMTGQEQNSAPEPQALVDTLDNIYQKFKYFALDDSYIEQIIKQLMYYICAVAMNNLMLRPEVCTWKSGMRIRYNVSCLETWMRDLKLAKEVLEPLQPLNEVAQVLQARKTEDEDALTITELCPTLTTGQVMKIIKSYTLDDYEQPMKPSFMEKLVMELKKRSNKSENESFSMDENVILGLAVAFKYSEIKLEEIELPSVLKLDGLLTKI